MDEFSVFSSIVSLPNTETHNQSIINNNHLMQQMVHESNWSVYVNNSGFFLNTDQNSTTTPIPQLLNLLHLPSSNLPYIMADSCFTYDPLFHLNLPSQPPLIPANDYSGLLFRIDINANQVVDSNVGNENIIDCEIIEFSKNIGRKERGKQKNKPFTTERDRRCHLNERYEALKLLIPSPSKGDRASILQDAIDYINKLQKRISELKYLVEKKRCGGKHNNNEVDNNNLNEDDDDNDAENMEKKPESNVIYQFSRNNSLRCSWLQRKSKETEVDVRIVDDEVTIKVVQKKKVNCLLFVSKVLDQFQLNIHHVTGGNIGEHYSFLFNTKIYEGSTTYASASANTMIKVVDKHYITALPFNNY